MAVPLNIEGRNPAAPVGHEKAGAGDERGVRIGGKAEIYRERVYHFPRLDAAGGGYPYLEGEFQPAGRPGSVDMAACLSVIDRTCRTAMPRGS